MDLKKQALIKTLENELKVVPMFSMFQSDNHLQINTALDYLNGNRTFDDIEEEYIDEDYDVVGFVEGMRGYLDGSSGDELADIIWNSESIVIVEDLIISDEPIAKTYNITVCKKLCGDCPFSKKSFKGFLADYTIQDFVDFQNNDVSFPCHKVMTDGDNSLDKVQKMFDNNELYFCRGYVESFIRSAKMPRTNTKLKEAIDIVRKEGLSDNGMSMHEFRKFHKL